MKRINKGTEPEFWKEFKRKHPQTSYRDLGQVKKGAEVRHKMREQLMKEQYYLCCYCCRQIDEENSLNEHIRPEDHYPNETMDFMNLVASCKKDIDSCGPGKKNKYDEELFVSPLDEDCEEHFIFFPNGEMRGVTDKGRYTVDLLSLDSYKLCQARAAKYRVCDMCDNELIQWYLEPHEGRLDAFPDMVSYFYERGFFTR